MKLANLPRLPSAFVTLAALTLATAVPLAADEQRARAPGPAPASAAKIDLNTVDRKTLEALPFLTPEVATAIIAARPFTSLNDLDRIKGISAEQLEHLRADVHVTAPPARQRLGEPSTTTPLASSPSAPVKTPLGEPTAPTHTPPRASSARLIDLNTADVKTLEAVPTIGPELARAIVAARPFSSLNDLNRIKGLTAEQLEHLRTVVTVSTR